MLSHKLGKENGIDNVINSDDYLFWNEYKQWQYQEKETVLKLVNHLFDKPEWIIEGNLGDYIARLEILEKADLVIILNPGFLKLIYRIITRALTRNTPMKIGKHTKENATIIGKFGIKEVIQDIIGSIQIVFSFKKEYIHYLIKLAKESNNFHKLKILSD